jgi:hypothetical protein
MKNIVGKSQSSDESIKIASINAIWTVKLRECSLFSTPTLGSSPGENHSVKS